MSAKLWLVTAGEYSDYRVVAAFEHEADARRAVDLRVGDSVTAVHLYGHGEAPVKRLVHTARAVLQADGTQLFESHCYTPNEQWIAEGALQRPEMTVEHEEGRIFITAECLDPDLALKACRDRDAKVRAEILTEPPV